MSNEMPELQFGLNWPEQIIVDHIPYWRAWRKQTRRCNDDVEAFITLIGNEFAAFANGKNVGPKLMADWVDHVKQIPGRKTGSTLKTAQANYYRQRVRSYVRWLHLMGAILKDPSDCMPKLMKAAPAPKLIFTHQEYTKMVQYADENGLNLEQWLLVLGYHTGMSLIDCCLLNWEEVFLTDDGPCFIRKPRRKLQGLYRAKCMCTIPILAGGELWVWLKRFQRIREKDPEPTGGVPYVSEDAYNLFTETSTSATVAMGNLIRRALGAESNGRTFKNLRNTFASRLINAGTDAVLVSKMTGHSDVNQLADYVVPDQTKMQDAVLKGLRFADDEPARPAEKKQDGACS